MYDEELNNILQNAYCLDNKLVATALEDERKFRQQSTKEVNNLRTEIVSLYQEKEMELEGLSESLLQDIEEEINLFRKLSERVNNSPPPLKTNKMVEVLSGTKELLANYLEELLDGDLPEGYQMPEQVLPFILGNNTSIYGCSTGTYLKAGLLELKKHLSATTNLTKNWIDQSAIAHIVAIPDNSDIMDFKNSNYYFSDPITPQGMVTIHSGYAFGGHREHIRYPNGKKFGPEDCSSWVAKCTSFKHPFTTADQFATYKYGLRKDFMGKDKWLKSSVSQEMTNIFEPAVVRDPQKDIKLGQIYVLRKFSENDPKDGLGAGGHTAIVLGSRSNGNVVTLGDSRNIPQNKEGYGIEEFSWCSKITDGVKQKVVYLKTS